MKDERMMLGHHLGHNPSAARLSRFDSSPFDHNDFGDEEERNPPALGAGESRSVTGIPDHNARRASVEWPLPPDGRNRRFESFPRDGVVAQGLRALG